MNKNLNILSIDWDYFIDADNFTRSMMFPDAPNEKYSKDLQQTIWCSRYCNDELLKVGVNKEAVSRLKKLFRGPNFDPMMSMIVDSHRYCYEFVHSFMRHGIITNFNLVNFDYHHDVYSNDPDGINCGNWVAKLIDEFPRSKFTWVHHENSDTYIDTPEYEKKIVLQTGIDHLKDYVWDAVFVCRSGMWSPPHLDKEFESIFKYLDERFNCYTEPEIFSTRYDHDLKESVKQQKEILAQLQKLSNSDDK